MRSFLFPWQLGAALVLAATGALAQPAATPTPTATPAEPARHRTVRVVLPAGDSAPEVGGMLPMDPVELIQTVPPHEAAKAPGNELVIAPLPLSNPALGSGLGLAAVYTIARKSDTRSPPTTLGGGGFYTSNGSWAGGAGVKMYLAEDRYRVTLGGALGLLNYDLLSDDSDGTGVPITQEFQGGLAELMVGLGRRWYVGARASYGTTLVGMDEDDELPVPPEQLDVTLATLSLKTERDSRDSVFYPRKGSLLEVVVAHSDTELGSDFTYTKTTVSFAEYLPLGEPVVLAVHGQGCYATEDAPFFDVCLFGTDNVLRGYTAGRWVDRWTVATQAEARWRFARRFIATAFVGAGGVRPAYGESDETEVLPAGGLGVQWIAAPESMITVRADLAFGEGGSRGCYVGIGQAF